MKNRTGSPLPLELTDEQLAAEARLAQVRLEALRAEENYRKEGRRKAVKPVYEFTLTPSNKPYDKIFDPSCRLYELSGRVTNKAALAESGQSVNLLFEGGMKYIFNGATGKFVMSTGGGSIFMSCQEGWDTLSNFILRNPEGGDVTVLVEVHRNCRTGF
jgi:hypothetical protein